LEYPIQNWRSNAAWRNKMFTGLFFMIVIAVVLYGLVNSTEKVLAIRHQQREDGKKPNVYL
jgi:ABC-type nitrate/sulfonate/bicarbonate transport system permease component